MGALLSHTLVLDMGVMGVDVLHVCFLHCEGAVSKSRLTFMMCTVGIPTYSIRFFRVISTSPALRVTTDPEFSDVRRGGGR